MAHITKIINPDGSVSWKHKGPHIAQKENQPEGKSLRNPSRTGPVKGEKIDLGTLMRKKAIQRKKGKNYEKFILASIGEHGLSNEYLQLTRDVPVKKLNQLFNTKASDPQAAGKNLLMYAILKGNKEVVNDLLSKPGINVNSVSSEGKTALNYAAHIDGAADIATELMAKGGKTHNMLEIEKEVPFLHAKIESNPNTIEQNFAAHTIEQAKKAAKTIIEASRLPGTQPNNSPAIAEPKSNSYVNPTTIGTAGLAVAAGVGAAYLAKKVIDRKNSKTQ